MFEQITNRSKFNINIHLKVMNMLDIIFSHDWYRLHLSHERDVWNIIYSINYIFDLNDIFKDTHLAERIMNHAKNFLWIVLETNSKGKEIVSQQ